MAQYHRDLLLLASDAAAEMAFYMRRGHYLYTVYDSPRQTILFDLKADPEGTRSYITEQAAKRYDQQILSDLKAIAQFYGSAHRQFER